MGFMSADSLTRAVLFCLLLGVSINLPADGSVAHSTGMSAPARSKLGLKLSDLAVQCLPSTNPRVCVFVFMHTHISERVHFYFTD